MEKSRKMNRLKLVFGIAVPMLVIVVTMVMVGVSFAWFSNSENVTISQITFSTAESYSVGFNVTTGNNMAYMGQYALKYDAEKKAGVLITDASDNDAPFYFVNTINLNTSGNTFNLSMAFDKVNIYKDNVDNGTRYGDGENDNPVSDIPYVFTWMFKKSAKDTATNCTGEGENKSMLPLKPQSGEIWYTPYGALTFDENGIVASINGKSDNVSSIGEPCSIIDFETGKDGKGEDFDFYIIFAPQELFYMQFFKGNQNATLQNTYADDIITKICGTLTNKMYYSDLGYSGANFAFTALISIEEGGKA